jgi:hypothetical protein
MTIFQSTHSQRVRHRSNWRICRASTISIHALTKSATPPSQLDHSSIEISIHALTKSATSWISAVTLILMISIHALTKSATFPKLNYKNFIIYFNPRTHKECDCEILLIISRDAIKNRKKPLFSLSYHKDTANILTLLHII